MTTNQDEVREKIQKDLDAGKFNQICSNETTFKEYVFAKFDILLAHKREEIEKLKLIEAIFPGQPNELLLRKQYHNHVIDQVIKILS